MSGLRPAHENLDDDHSAAAAGAASKSLNLAAFEPALTAAVPQEA